MSQRDQCTERGDNGVARVVTICSEVATASWTAGAGVALLDVGPRPTVVVVALVAGLLALLTARHGG